MRLANIGLDHQDRERRSSETHMDGTIKTVAAVEGAPSRVVQALFGDLVQRWRQYARIVGVLATDHGLDNRACSAGYLHGISKGIDFPIFHDLGSGSTACHIDGAGMASASEAVCQDIAAGCDLVVLSKFGKLEAEGRGLASAFVAAMDAGVPVLTSVSRAHLANWLQFSAPYALALPPDADRIEAWWNEVCPRDAYRR